MKRILISFTGILIGLSIASTATAQQKKYDKVKAMMKQIAESHPQTTQLIQVGDSNSGEPIVGLQIGRGQTRNLVVATHHGNEYGSTAVAVGFADALAKQPLQGQTIFVIPVLNIAGYNAGQRREPADGRTWDPNRDYPGPCGTEGPFRLKSTAALAKFVAENQIVTSATLHTFFPGVLYPWGISTRDTSTPYDNIFEALGKAATYISQYAVGNSTQLLYPADGTFEDYAFAKHGIWSLLFELGKSHNPNSNQIAEMVRVNVPGLMKFLATAPRSRAQNHAFTGRCDGRLKRFDRHDE
jgi:carboxypeptidase T